MLFLLGGAFAIMIPLSEVRLNGTVYADLDVNGMRDEGELGMQYIPIKVVDVNDTEVAHSSTDEDGYYRATVNCVPGESLWVTAVAPEGTHHTRDVRYEFTCQDGASMYSLFGLAGTRCLWNYDCADDEYCMSELCIPLVCGEGTIPDNHECVPEPECTSPLDCAYNETCSGLVCVPLSCAGVEGYIIDNHKCRVACTENDDCADNEYCGSAGGCVPLSCAEGYVMENHACVPEAECTEDEDCALDEICSAGSCVQVVCPEGYEADNHGCVYVPPEEKPPEEVPPEEKPPAEEKPPEEVPEEEQPEDNVTVEIPEGEAPAEGISDLVLAVFIVAVAAIVIVYMTVYKKKAV